MGRDTLEKVDWTLPGMEKFTEDQRRLLERLIENEDIVHSLSSLGWALWPTSNRGYYDENFLRMIADFIEIQNKPVWDEYDKWCQENIDENDFIDSEEEAIALQAIGLLGVQDVDFHGSW